MPDPAPNLLGSLNNSLTAVGAIVGTLGTIVATIAAILANDAKQEATGAKVAADHARNEIEALQTESTRLANRRERERSATDFAKEIVSRAGEDKTEIGKKKGDKILVASLQVMADAASDDEGIVSADKKRGLPLRLALENGDYLALAMGDPDLACEAAWVPVALWDDETPRLRFTTMRALNIICKNALRNDKCDVVNRAIEIIFDIQSRSKKLIARAEPRLLETEAPGFDKLKEWLGKARQDYFDLVLEIADLQAALKDSAWKCATDVEKAKNQELTFAEIVAGIPTPDKTAAATATGIAAPEYLSKSQNPNAADILATAEGTLATLRSEISQTDQSRIPALIQNVTSDDTLTRRSARTELSLAGQSAVRPILDALRAIPSGPLSGESYRIQIGALTALMGMKSPPEAPEQRPPLITEAADLAALAALLGSSNYEIRSAAVDFIIDLENPETIRAMYPVLLGIVNKSDSTTDPRLLTNAITALGGWVTALSPSINGTKLTASPSMRLETLLQLEAWQNDKKFESILTVKARLKYMIEKGQKAPGIEKERADYLKAKEARGQ